MYSGSLLQRISVYTVRRAQCSLQRTEWKWVLSSCHNPETELHLFKSSPLSDLLLTARPRVPKVLPLSVSLEMGFMD